MKFSHKIAAIGAGLMFGAALAVGLPTSAAAYTQYKDIVSTGHGSLDASYLVIHDTDDYGATASQLMSYWRSGQTPYVVHYTMDVDGSVVYQAMEEDRKAWQVGYGNPHVIGIELCYATNQADFDAQWEEATQWAADFLKSHGWGIDRMISHHMASERWGGSDHTDPDGYFETYGHSWGEFVSDVSAKLGSSTEVAAPATEYTNGGSGTTLSFAGGTYTCTVDALNIRTSPGGTIVGRYTKGQTVDLDRYCIKQDGYIWGKYTAYSGNVRYVCVGRATGGVASDDYLIKADATSTYTYGIDVDGYVGYNTITAWQQQLHTGIVDGSISGHNTWRHKYAWSVTSWDKPYLYGSHFIRVLQQYLNDHGYSVGYYGADGYIGRDTVKAVQRYLQDKGYNIGQDGVDGYLGTSTARALQQSLNDDAWE